MTSTSMKAKIVNIKVEKDASGLLFATSDELKGLLVAEPTVEALRTAVPAAIKDLFTACGVNVVVTEVEDNHDDFPQWVAIPTAKSAQFAGAQ